VEKNLVFEGLGVQAFHASLELFQSSDMPISRRRSLEKILVLGKFRLTPTAGLKKMQYHICAIRGSWPTATPMLFDNISKRGRVPRYFAKTNERSFGAK
jgi:hypothetical protein